MGFLPEPDLEKVPDSGRSWSRNPVQPYWIAIKYNKKWVQKKTVTTITIAQWMIAKTWVTLLQRWLVIIESNILNWFKPFGSWDSARERWGETWPGNDGSVTGSKKAMETGIRFTTNCRRPVYSTTRRTSICKLVLRRLRKIEYLWYQRLRWRWGLESASFFILSTSFCSLSSWFTSSCAYHLITVTTFALITYHCLYISLQT